MKLVLVYILFHFSINSFSSDCLGSICINSTVIPLSYISGKAIVRDIFGPSNGAIVENFSTGKFEIYPLIELAIIKGCLDKVCTQDNVIPRNLNYGYLKVAGINFFSKEYVLIDNDKYILRRISTLAITNGCLMNICVGNRVEILDPPYGQGFVAAINYHTKRFVILHGHDNENMIYHHFNLRVLR